MPVRQLLYLSSADVAAVRLPMIDTIRLVETAFIEKGRGRYEMPPKPGIHTRPDAFIHAMPAWIPSMRAAGIKWVGGYPENPRYGLPYISGLLILNDSDTGIPYAVMDCTWITAMRTGAATAVSAKFLACPDSKSVGILACGVQGRTNLEALACLFPIQRVYAYDTNPRAQEQYVADMRAQYPFEIIPVSEPKQAVINADLVVTSGPIQRVPTPTIPAGWLRPGAFASAVDFDSYWTSDALAQIDRFVTDDHAQFQYYRSIGYFQRVPDPYADLGELAARLKPGRQEEQERALAMNLGLALGDMAVAPEIYRRAVEMGVGAWLPL